MDNLILVLQILILLGIGCLFIFRNYLTAYSKQKGQNLATSEDIQTITSKIEDVKHEYAHQLETTKASLLSKISNHGYRYEKEYEILEKIMECLIEYKSALLRLRPRLDFIDPSQSEDERKRERLDRVNKARYDLFCVREKSKPFYAEDIHEALMNLDTTAENETLDYEYLDPKTEVNNYWQQATENKDKIIEAANKAIEAIRVRVMEWDDIV